MKNSIQVSFALILFVLGIAISLQYKSTQKNLEISEKESKSIQTVQAELIRQKSHSEDLLKQIDDYKQKIDNYEKNANVEETMKRDLQVARIFAGTEDVKGKGIEISIDDTKNSNEPLGTITSSGYMVSDIDLLEIINEIRAAGAQAISINDERIIAMTEIRRAGIYIRINNKNYNSPFKIKAIGDPNVLESALKIREGIIEYLVINGISVTIEKKDSVDIPRYKGTMNTNYINGL